MASNSGKQKGVLQRMHDHVGGVLGWIGITVGLLLMGGGITALIYEAGASATIGTTAVGLGVLTATGTLALGIVGLIVGAAMITAILLYPMIKAKMTARLHTKMLLHKTGGLPVQKERLKKLASQQFLASEKKQSNTPNEDQNRDETKPESSPQETRRTSLSNVNF